MSMKIYEKSVDELLGFPEIIKDEEKQQVFYQELVKLSNNERFLTEIDRLRKKYKEGEVKLLKSALFSDITELSVRTRLANTKYKSLVVPAIISFLIKGSFLDFIKSKPINSEGKIKPSISLDKSDGEVITISIKLYSDTSKAQVNQLLKNNWVKIQKLQEQHKQKRAPRQKGSFERDYKGFYIPYELDMSYKEIHDALSKGSISTGGIIHSILRLKKEIKESFN